MGYQESWLYIEPQWNFKKLIHAYEQAKAAGHYEVFGAEPLSVIILKRPFGKIPAGKKLVWVCGDRCVHNVRGIFGQNLNFFGKLQIIPIEEVLDMNDCRLKGIDFGSHELSENKYMQRYDIVDYAYRLRTKQAPNKSTYPER